MRTTALLALTLLLQSCGLTAVATHFKPIADLRTTQPRSLVEGGYSEPVVPPPGVSWTVNLVGLEDETSDGIQTRRYEMTVVVVDRQPGASPDRVRPALDDGALVDDDGRSFPPHRMQIVTSKAKQKSGQPPPPRTFVVVFDLPPSYLFRRVLRATVHWGLRVGQDPVLRISSRFGR